MTTTTKTAKTASLMSECEPIMLRRRIGSTEYVIKVMYSKTATETLEDKLTRLIENDPLMRETHWQSDQAEVRKGA